jgi:hypothetical protein
VRTNYDALATAVAQVLPILLVATFVENRFLPRGRRDLFFRVYQRLALWLGWLGLIGSFAYLAGGYTGTTDVFTRLFLVVWLVSVAMLAGLLVLNARYVLTESRTRSPNTTTLCSSQPVTRSDTRPGNWTVLAVIILLSRLTRRR